MDMNCRCQSGQLFEEVWGTAAGVHYYWWKLNSCETCGEAWRTAGFFFPRPEKGIWLIRERWIYRLLLCALGFCWESITCKLMCVCLLSTCNHTVSYSHFNTEMGLAFIDSQHWKNNLPVKQLCVHKYCSMKASRSTTFCTFAQCQGGKAEKHKAKCVSIFHSWGFHWLASANVAF